MTMSRRDHRFGVWQKQPRVDTWPPRRTGPKQFTPACECDELPWDDCEHTRDEAADREIDGLLDRLL